MPCERCGDPARWSPGCPGCTNHPPFRPADGNAASRPKEAGRSWSGGPRDDADVDERRRLAATLRRFNADAEALVGLAGGSPTTYPMAGAAGGGGGGGGGLKAQVDTIKVALQLDAALTIAAAIAAANTRLGLADEGPLPAQAAALLRRCIDDRGSDRRAGARCGV
jgi:hypothetical protein